MPSASTTPDLIKALDGSVAPAVLYGSSRWQVHHQEPLVGQRLGGYAIIGVGEGAHSIELEGRQWRMAAGSVAILPPGRPWLHRIARGGRLLYVVGVAVATRMVKDGKGPGYRIASREPRQPGPLDIWGVDLPILQPDRVAQANMTDLQGICDLWWRSEMDRMRANHLFAGILLRAVMEARSPGMRAGESQVPDPLIRRALDLLTRSIPATTQAWASQVGLHRNRFTERFQAALGETPNAYLHRLRLHRAEALILAGHHSLDYVAVESGFRNPAALSHAFRRVHGCGASVWRQRTLAG